MLVYLHPHDSLLGRVIWRGEIADHLKLSILRRARKALELNRASGERSEAEVALTHRAGNLRWKVVSKG